MDKNCCSYHIHAIVNLILLKKFDLLVQLVSKKPVSYFNACNNLCQSLTKCRDLPVVIKREINELGYHSEKSLCQQMITTFVQHVSLFTLAMYAGLPEIIILFIRKGVKPVHDDIWTAVAMLKQRSLDAILMYFGSDVVNRRINMRRFPSQLGTPFTYLMEAYSYYDRIWREREKRALKMIIHLHVKHGGNLLTIVSSRYFAWTYLLLMESEQPRMGDRFKMKRYWSNGPTVQELAQRDQKGRLAIDNFFAQNRIFFDVDTVCFLITAGFNLHELSPFSKCRRLY